MTYIKLQIAGNLYFTKVDKDHLDSYINLLNEVLASPKSNTIFTYDAIDTELEFKKLVFKETALEAFAVLN